MSLPSGSRLGPYEIVSLLGAGGMGEVYRTRDTRLDRIVALKVLRPELVASEPLRARFEREARAISALSHPNICSLFDVGHEGGVEYIVMEYLDGESLADRLRKGALPLTLVIRYGAQIAEALHHAHRAGLTHRDLKPGNIMLTAAGAKLLDFGLARATETAASRVYSQESAVATAVQPLTGEGMIVGTVPYMSPEQLEGRTVDPRSDIFSLGIVLYEMATGQRPFQGDSPVSIAAAILNKDPLPIHTVQPSLPPTLERVILTALEKNPEERWQSAQDLARQIRWAGESSQQTVEAVSLRRARRVMTRRVAWISALMLALAAALVTGWYAGRRTTGGHGQLEVQIAPPEGISILENNDIMHFAVSPDGRTICFVGSAGPGRSLYVRSLDSFEVHALEGTEGAMAPFFSPDGQWIGFSAGGRLCKMRLKGGAGAEPLTAVSAGGAVGSWNGNTILFADAPGAGRRGIMKVPDSGGSATVVRDPDPKRGEFRLGWPLFMPDGKHYLYLVFYADKFERNVMFASLDPGEPALLIKDASQVALSGPGQLAFVREGTLLEQRFDASRGTLSGDPVAVASAVNYFSATAGALFSASTGGTLAFQTSSGRGRLDIVDRKGTQIRVLDEGPDKFWDAEISRDGRRAAVTVMGSRNGMGDIWLYDIARGTKDRFTSAPSMEFGPIWSPDGRFIVHSQVEGGAIPHLVERVVSTGAVTSLTPVGEFYTPQSFSPDGSIIYLTHRDRKNRNDILRLSMETRQLEPVLVTPSDEGSPELSPRGDWMAYSSDATGRREIYLQNMLRPDEPRIRISEKGGRNPHWRGDSGELYYQSLDGFLLSAKPDARGQWEEARSEVLFRLDGLVTDYGPLPDGQSFMLALWNPGQLDEVFHVIVGAGEN